MISHLLPFSKIVRQWKQGSCLERFIGLFPLWLGGFYAILTWPCRGTALHRCPGPLRCEKLLPVLVEPRTLNTGEKKVQGRSWRHGTSLRFSEMKTSVCLYRAEMTGRRFAFWFFFGLVFCRFDLLSAHFISWSWWRAGPCPLYFFFSLKGREVSLSGLVVDEVEIQT